MTVIESKGGYQGLKIAWMGDGNNVAQSWINAAAILGFDLTLGCPPDYFPDQDILEAAKAAASTEINILADPEKAVAGADVIYTDVWASMGQEDEQQKREKVFAPYQVNDGLVSKAAADAIVMHCLPAHRGEEISDAVMEGPQSVIWDQSENKLHMHKAILEALMS
jgi:ornithine carbamoyltransferase